MARGLLLELLLADGTPDGVWQITAANWNGLVARIPRSALSRERLHEFDRPGAYLLVGPSDQSSDKDAIYVGEADSISDRVFAHVHEKEFWTHLVICTSENFALNKAHVQYLESRLVALARESGRYDVLNSVSPKPPQISVADRHRSDAFLDHLLVILPTLGIGAFQASRAPKKAEDRYYLKLKGITAEAILLPDESMQVLAGATAMAETTANTPPRARKEREGLLAEGKFVREGDLLRLVEATTFNSPSLAASVLLAHAANGRHYWRNGNGDSINDVEGRR